MSETPLLNDFWLKLYVIGDKNIDHTKESECSWTHREYFTSRELKYKVYNFYEDLQQKVFNLAVKGKHNDNVWKQNYR